MSLDNDDNDISAHMDRTDPAAYMRSIHTTRIVAQTIAHKTSHSFQKHHVDANEFNDPHFGRPLNIKSAEDLQQHAFNVLASAETTTINPRGTTLYAYHQPTETVVILNVYSPRQKEDGGTIYRRYADDGAQNSADDSVQGSTQNSAQNSTWYQRLVALEAERMGVESFPVVPGGLIGRLMRDDEFAGRLEERYSKLYENKKQKAKESGLARMFNDTHDALTSSPQAQTPSPPKSSARKSGAKLSAPQPGGGLN